VYQRYGDDVRNGLIPYGDFYTEYPPMAVPIFVVPTIGDAEDYVRNSKLTQLVLAAVALLLVVWICSRLRRPPPELYIAALVVAVSPALLGRVSFTRFDFWPATLTVAALAVTIAGRVRLSGGVLALATLAKIYPAVLLPLALLYTGRREGRDPAYRLLAAYAVVMVAVLAPLAAVGAGGLRFTLLQQLGRPLQLESVASSLLLVADQLHLYQPHVIFTDSSFNLGGRLPEVLGTLFSLVGLGVLCLLWIAFQRGPRDASSLVTAAAAAVAVFVASGRVLSPQYLIWLIPLVPLVRGRTMLKASILLLVTLGITQVWSQGGYMDLIDLKPVVWLLFVRNVLLVTLAVVLCREALRRFDPIAE
jgi:hypothetical protein